MVGIVGGGISGLVLGHHLGRAGVPHAIFEAAEEPGGVMRTVERQGVPLDLGPQRTRLTPDLAELIERVGLQDELVFARNDLPLWTYRAGKLRRVPLSPSEALTTDAVSLVGKLRMLLEPFTAGPKPDESVETFLTRKFGREAYEAFLGPLYGGLYASDPGRMMARHGLAVTLREFGVKGSLLLVALRKGLSARRRIPTVSFRDGLGTLPSALAREAGSAFRPASAITRMRRVGDRLVLVVGKGDEQVEVDRVVLALPSPAAAKLLGEVAPAAAERVAALNVNHLAVVHLESDCDLEGFGYQVAFGEPLETRGVTWNASMFDRPGVHTAYLGGMKNPRAADWPDERLRAVAESEFETVTGWPARSLHVSRTQIPAWDESWDALDGLRLPRDVHVCANWSGRPGIPGRLAQARRVASEIQEAEPAQLGESG